LAAKKDYRRDAEAERGKEEKKEGKTQQRIFSPKGWDSLAQGSPKDPRGERSAALGIRQHIKGAL
jgi:hypothetical protein